MIGAEQHRAVDLSRPRLAAGGVLGTFGYGEGFVRLVDHDFVTGRIHVGMSGHLYTVNPAGSGMTELKITELVRQCLRYSCLERRTRLEIRHQKSDLRRLLR